MRNVQVFLQQLMDAQDELDAEEEALRNEIASIELVPRNRGSDSSYEST